MLWVTNGKRQKTFKVLSDSLPITEYIPVVEEDRVELYNKFIEKGIPIPDYEEFKRIPEIDLADMQVLVEDFEISISYLGSIYSFTIKAGFCFDGASVPEYLRYNRVNNNSQFNLSAAIIHDILYAQGLFPKEDCDNFFEGILRHNGLDEWSIFFYILGLKVGGGKRYRQLRLRYADPKKYWGYNFYKLVVTL